MIIFFKNKNNTIFLVNFWLIRYNCFHNFQSFCSLTNLINCDFVFHFRFNNLKFWFWFRLTKKVNCIFLFFFYLSILTTKMKLGFSHTENTSRNAYLCMNHNIFIFWNTVATWPHKWKNKIKTKITFRKIFGTYYKWCLGIKCINPFTFNNPRFSTFILRKWKKKNNTSFSSFIVLALLFSKNINNANHPRRHLIILERVHFVKNRKLLIFTDKSK